ncbi:MAG: DsbA family protein [Pseudomonadales bacterium]|nr:DsbA family protein [Pseudomonadales bacterium]
MSKLEIYIDFKSPYAFIAKDANYALEEAYGIEIDWYPLTLNIKSYLGSAKKKAGKVIESNRTSTQWLAVKYAYKDARRYASLRNLVLKGTEKIWDSSLAGIGLLWAKQQSRTGLKSYIDVVFERFWQRKLDIEDIDVIVSVLQAAGVDTAGFVKFALAEGRIIHDALQNEILEKGYYGVPTYVVDNEVYFGREHLPRVRWHLQGREGEFPDIAYDSQVI